MPVTSILFVAMIAFALTAFRLFNNLRTMQTQAGLQIDQTIKQVDQLTTQIADLNASIRLQKAQGVEPNDLYDQRDQALHAAVLGLEPAACVFVANGETLWLYAPNQTLINDMLALFPAFAWGYGTPDFPCPPALEKRVEFWVKIFSQVSGNERVLHDSRYPWIVYETISVPDLDQDAIKGRIEERKKHKPFGAGPGESEPGGGTDSPGPLPAGVLAAVLVLFCLCAFAMDAIGIHAVFGGFLLGCSLPRGPLTHKLREMLQPFVVVFLLPMFFTYSGLNTRLDLLLQPALMLAAVAILLASFCGKGVACWAAARLNGEANSEAMAIGALMNARGLMELIIINIGLAAGVIEVGLFSILVLMAVVTTLMATPLFDWIVRRDASMAPPAEGTREPVA